MEPNDADVEMATLLKDEGSPRLSSGSNESSELDPTLRRRSGRIEGKVHADESFEKFYTPVEGYEGRHRYDPKFKWDAQDEKKVVRKVL